MRAAQPFDAEAFVDDLLAAGCQMAVHQPIGRGDEPAYWIVYPADLDGTPTEGERTVRARWEASMAACRGYDKLVLAVCQRRIQKGRLHEAASEQVAKLAT